jgi:putative FmdB family regulatory protein
MPIHEFACQQCGHQFETLVRSASSTPECPQCHSTELSKQLSVFATSNSSQAAAAPMMAGPCGTCGHPDGPGACAMN